MKPCPVCHKEVEAQRIEHKGCGIWIIMCCGDCCQAASLNVVVQIWDALERDREDL